MVTSVDHLMCTKAASFHPNPAGAEAYARAVVDRYQRHATPSVRTPVSNLSRRDGEGAPMSVRDALERYDLEPEFGLRAALSHTVVDSIAVEIVTGDDGTDSAVFLSLAGETWELDTKFTDKVDDNLNFDRGDVNRFVIDPILTTERTADDPLYLWEIDDVVIEKRSNFSADWEIAGFSLWINRIRVYETDESVTLTGDTERTFPYPRRSARATLSTSTGETAG